MEVVKVKTQTKCVHFNGLMNERCNAGVTYLSVLPNGPGLPCIREDGELWRCRKAEFRESEANT